MKSGSHEFLKSLSEAMFVAPNHLKFRQIIDLSSVWYGLNKGRFEIRVCKNQGEPSELYVEHFAKDANGDLVSQGDKLGNWKRFFDIFEAQGDFSQKYIADLFPESQSLLIDSRITDKSFTLEYFLSGDFQFEVSISHRVNEKSLLVPHMELSFAEPGGSDLLSAEIDFLSGRLAIESGQSIIRRVLFDPPSFGIGENVAVSIKSSLEEYAPRLFALAEEKFLANVASSVALKPVSNLKRSGPRL